MTPPLRVSAMFPAAALLAGAALLGCPGTLTDKGCFVNEERAHTLLVASCTDAGCHNAKDKSTGLDLESAGLGERLRGQAAIGCSGALIEPGDPEASILYGKVQAPPPCGSRMPLGRPELFPEDIEVLRLWIAGMDGSCADATTATSGAGGGAGGSSTTTSTGAAGGTGGTGGGI